MASQHCMFKPGEPAPRDGVYVCHICAARSEDSRCELHAGELFRECPRCKERGVAEWDLAWVPAEPPGDTSRPAPAPWPGALYGSRR